MPADTTYPEPPGWLAAIPGYRGYHAKEQRRQADRALREDLARRVTSAVGALQRVSATLARERRYADIATVDQLISRLQHLADRLQSQPEGYRGLFQQERIDEEVLDQIIAFDRSLASGIERLGTLAGQAGAGAPILGDESGQELTALVERLHTRLDARTAVLSSGQALAPQAALAVLAEPAPLPAPPLALKAGDALAYGDANYLVDAAITYAGERAWTEYRLRDGSRERWLVVQGDEASLLEPVAEPIAEADEAATFDGRRYTLAAQGQASAALSGPSGTRRNVPVTFRDYRDEADSRLAVREWGDERRVLHGQTVERELLNVFPRA